MHGAVDDGAAEPGQRRHGRGIAQVCVVAEDLGATVFRRGRIGEPGRCAIEVRTGVVGHVGRGPPSTDGVVLLFMRTSDADTGESASRMASAPLRRATHDGSMSGARRLDRIHGVGPQKGPSEINFRREWQTRLRIFTTTRPPIKTTVCVPVSQD